MKDLQKILILGLNFPPEEISTGRYTGELARFLKENGWNVHVVCSHPYYPQWEIYKSYIKWQYKKEVWNGIQIYHCPIWVASNFSNLKRIPHLLSFAFSSFPVTFLEAFWKPDIVMCIVPTIFCAPTALLVARLINAKAWVHIQDFELDTAFNMQMLPGQRIIKPLSETLEKIVLKHFDYVSTISENMIKRCKEKGIESEKIVLFPNWVNTNKIFPFSKKNSLRSQLGLSKKQIVVLYHGNMGKKQGLEFVIKAAELMQDNKNIIYLFCGEGSERKKLASSAKNFPNVKFYGLQPENKLNLLVNLADIHVLPQLADVSDLVMPSKLSTMLASGKPVIATVLADTGVGEVVSQTGVLVPPEDAAALAGAILRLAQSPAERARLGKKGCAYALEHWSAEKILNQFHQIINNLV